MVLAAFGSLRLKVDDSLSQLFRSDTPEFKQFEEVTRRFPSAEYDVLIVIEGKNLLARENLERLRNLVTDVQLIDGTRGIISLFSARQPPEGNQLPAPLFPAELPEGAEYQALVKRILSNEIIRGKLLSEDGELALVVLALNPAIVQTRGLNDTIGEIRKTMAENLEGSGLRNQLAGVPVMQLEIRNAVERDRLLYNAFGFAAGCLIAILFFRRVSFMIIAAAPPLVAILLSLGFLGWLDFRLNMFLNVMTPLIMVISFADSMQLTFAARDRLIAGREQVRRVPRRAAGGRSGLRADPRHRGDFVHRADVLELRADPHVRRSGSRGDRDRAARRSHAGAVARRSPDPQRGEVHRHAAGQRHRRHCAAPLLQLDRGAHGEPSGALQLDRRCWWSSVSR